MAHLRAGIIGTGFIGPVHLEALRRLGVQVTAVCGSCRGAGAAAVRWGIPEVHGDYDYRGLVASPNVDVVHITSPNRFHCEQALAAIRAGKHCVCEKPLAMSTRETAAVSRAARKSRRVFAVNYNVRFYPAVLALRGMVARGELGEVIHVNGAYLQDWLLLATDYNWRLLPGEGGALRAVADIGTHWLDTASFILGAPVTAVFAQLGTFHRRRRRPLGELKTFARARAARYRPFAVKTEDFGNLLLEFRGGARGNLAVSQVAAGRKNSISIEVYGSKKAAAWRSEEPESLWLGYRDRANEVALRGTPAFGADAAPYCDHPPGHVEGFPDTFKMLFRAVYAAIAAGRRRGLFASAADGHREAALCEAVLKSHREKAWVKL
jgi:predicted dehydrogenase